MKQSYILALLCAILVAFITTILVVFVDSSVEGIPIAKPDDQAPSLDDPPASSSDDPPASSPDNSSSSDEVKELPAEFQMLNGSINFGASTCLTCLFHQEHPGGLFGDYQVYQDVLENSAYVKAPDLNTPPSKVQMYMEQTMVHYPSVNQSFWLMVNLEYLEQQLSKGTPSISMAFVKTRRQAELLADYRRREGLEFGIMLTGHTSNDVYDPSFTQDYTKFIHIAGKSPLKNTRVVVETWLKHPEWPKLTVIVRLWQFGDLIEKTKGVANINFYYGRLSFEELARLQNTNGIHVCPSEAEGFGHYINEARALKAVVITSNAAPMNELISSQTGVLIGQQSGSRGVANASLARVTQQDMERGVAKVLAMSLEQRKAMGERGREMYLKERAEFRQFLENFNAAICNSQDDSKLHLLFPYLYRN